MILRSLPILTLVLFFFNIEAPRSIVAQNLNFTATANPSTIYEGEIFELSFAVNSNQWGDFFMPEMDNFQRISGPARSSQTSVVNGQVSHTTTMSWRFRATSAGEYTIDQGVLEMNGQRLTSNPVEILVLPQSAEMQAASRDILIKAEVSCDTCYVGQQIAVDLYLYTTKSITDYSILSAPDFDGFNAKRFGNIRNFRTTRDTLENRIYNKHLLRRFILFPQMPGDFEFEGFDLRVVEQDRSSRWGGLLSVGGEVHYLSGSVPVITVVSEPEGAPEGFTGLIGDFQIAGRFSPVELREGELTAMRLVLRGDGDPAQMRLPQIELSDGVSIADVQFENEQIEEFRGRFRYNREWRVLLRADEAGWATAYPKITAYNVEKDSFYQVFGDTLRLQILASEGGELVLGRDDGDTTAGSGGGFFSTPLAKYGIPTALVLLSLIFFLAYRKRNISVTEKNEFEIFRDDLDKIGETQFSDQKSHYTAVLHALESFLVKITGLPMSEWNEADLKEKLTAVAPEKASLDLLQIRQALINSAYGYYPYEGDELESLLLGLIEEMEG